MDQAINELEYLAVIFEVYQREAEEVARDWSQPGDKEGIGYHNGVAMGYKVAIRKIKAHIESLKRDPRPSKVPR